MKFLLLLFLLISMKAFAQEENNEPFETRKNALKISPLRAVTYKFNLEYERKLSPYFSFGAISDIYYDMSIGFYNRPTWNGISAFKNSIYLRLYPWGKNLKGFYFQGKIISVLFYDDYTVTTTTQSYYQDWQGNISSIDHHIDSEQKTQFSKPFGIAAGFGYQTFLDKEKRFPIDLKLEFQIVDYPFIYDKEISKTELYDMNNTLISTSSRVESENHEDWGEELEFYFLGPGAFIYPSLKFGYTF